QKIRIKLLRFLDLRPEKQVITGDRRRIGNDFRHQRHSGANGRPNIWVHDTFLSRPRLARPAWENRKRAWATHRYRLCTSANHPEGERARRTVERRLSSTAHRTAASRADSGRSRGRARAAKSDPKRSLARPAASRAGLSDGVICRRRPDIAGPVLSN